jgi:hypothetical protein
VLNVRQHYYSQPLSKCFFVQEDSKGAPDVFAETVKYVLVTEDRRVSVFMGVLDNPFA